MVIRKPSNYVCVQSYCDICLTRMSDINPEPGSVLHRKFVLPSVYDSDKVINCCDFQEKLPIELVVLPP